MSARSRFAYATRAKRREKYAGTVNMSDSRRTEIFQFPDSKIASGIASGAKVRPVTSVEMSLGISSFVSHPFITLLISSMS